MDDASGTIRRLAARVGEPIVRAAVAQAVRIMGEQFVLGRDHRRRPSRGPRRRICSAPSTCWARARARQPTPSATKAPMPPPSPLSARSLSGPEHAHGISVKLSALSPRYEATQEARVWSELYPRLKRLAEMAAKADINFTLDAEEADRLVLSLKLLERLAREPSLGDWRGLGLAVQAYQKRAPRRDRRAGGAGEGQRPPPDGAPGQGRLLGQRDQARPGGAAVPGYPVFTTKPATDLSYLASARRR